MAKIEVREMSIHDYNQAVTLWSKVEGIGLSKADSKENIARYLGRNPGFCFVAEYQNAVVGTILCGHDGRRGYIHHLAVDETYRRQGLGRELVSRVLDKLVSEQIEKCHLFVLNDNEVGLKFWSETGWIKRDELSVVSRDIPEGKTD